MEQSFGSHAIQTLQRAYGFATDRPLWDSQKLFDLLAKAYPGLTEISCRNQQEIRHVMNTWNLGAATVSAGSHSETYARAESTGATTLTIQYAGHSFYTQDGVRMANRPLENAMLLVDSPGTALTEDVSSLVLAFDPELVRDTAQTMFGTSNCKLNLHPHIIEFKAPPLQRYAARLPFALAGLYQYPRLSEDLVHRFIARLIVAPGPIGKRLQRSALKTNQIDLVCAYVIENLHEEITLTDLEKVSLLSSRTLQAEFLHRFGVSPMAWLLQQRLERAFHLLRRGTQAESIAGVAFQCGFRHMGRFSGAFKKRFGVKPSDLLGKSVWH